MLVPPRRATVFVPVSNRLRAYVRQLLTPALLALALLPLAPAAARAGGPKYIAGTSFFNPGVLGQPIHWAGQIAQPSDVTPAAATYPLAVIYDADGSVIDAVFGATASQPTSCQNNGVFVWMDNLNPDATIAHAVILLNGLCATNADLLAMMSYQLERAFGRVLGLDYSQVNPGALTNSDANSLQGWPVMQPLSGVCGHAGGQCIPNPAVLRFDDIASLNRIYPITAQNLASFSGKQLTAPSTA